MAPTENQPKKKKEPGVLYSRLLEFFPLESHSWHQDGRARPLQCETVNIFLPSFLCIYFPIPTGQRGRRPVVRLHSHFFFIFLRKRW